MNHDRTIGFVGLLSVLAAAACAAGPVELPEPRPLVLRSGARLLVDDTERLQVIYDELVREGDNIELDPSFLIDSQPQPGEAYPWETLEIVGDTARISFQRTADDARASYETYAHLHIMKRMGRLDEWLPDAADADGFELERAIVAKVADAWLLGRAVFGFAPDDIMDELTYAREAGQLDALLLTLRADEFPDERKAWLEGTPAAEDDFRSWYRETFGKEAPEPRGRGGTGSGR